MLYNQTAQIDKNRLLIQNLKNIRSAKKDELKSLTNSGLLTDGRYLLHDLHAQFGGLSAAQKITILKNHTSHLKSEIYSKERENKSLSQTNIALHKKETKSTIKPKLVLHRAVVNGPSDFAKILQENKQYLQQKDDQGRTPLHFAAAYNRLDFTQLLIESGANITAIDSEGLSPLHQAASHGHLDIIKLLMNYAAPIDQRDNHEGYTPLYMAAASGQTDAAELLLKKGALVNQQSQRGHPPLVSAAVSGHIDTVKLLLKYGASIDILKNDGYSYSLLTYCRPTDTPNYRELKEIIENKFPESQLAKREFLERHLLGHIFSLKCSSNILPKVGSHILKLNFESSPSRNWFWKKISDHFETLDLSQHIQHQNAKVIFHEALQYVKNHKPSARELFQRWKEGKPIFMDIGYNPHSATALIFKNKFIIIDRSGDYKVAKTYTILDITEEAISKMLDLKNKSQSNYYSLTHNQFPIEFFKEQSLHDLEIQEQLRSEIDVQSSGNCEWASKCAAAYSLFKLLGGNMTFSDISTLYKCARTEKYLNRFDNQEQPYHPSPLFLAQLASHLKVVSEKNTSPVKAQVEQTLSSINLAWKKLQSYPIHEMPETIKKAWRDELEQSKEVMDPGLLKQFSNLFEKSQVSL